MRLEASRFIAESYFEFQSDKTVNAVGTSKKSFSKYAGRPSSKQFLDYLKDESTSSASNYQQKDIEELHERIKNTLFVQWESLLNTGINLALYGYGSKTKLFDDFGKYLQESFHILRMKAYESLANFSFLLQELLKNVYSIQERPTRDPVLLAKRIRQEQAKTLVPTILIIEMADAPCMRSIDIWKALAELVEPFLGIHLIFSFEHANSRLLTDEIIWKRLKLAWIDATTMRPYGLELLTLNPKGQSAVDLQTRYQGAQFVLASLTQTARSVYRILAEHQQNQMNNQSRVNNCKDNGNDKDDEDDGDDGDDDDELESSQRKMSLSIASWYQQCQEQFIVSNELAFRTQLTEFIDHELIKAVDELGQNGNEFFIPFQRKEIALLLEKCR